MVKKRRQSIGSRVFDTANIVFMLFLLFVTAYPMYFVIIASFSDPTQLWLNPGALWLPLQPFTLEGYRMVFSNPLITSGFLNTLFILVVGVSINLAMTVLTAYGLSIRGPMLKTALTFMIIFTMYFSGGLVPKYLNVKDLGLLNSLWSLILPGALSTTNMVIMKSAMTSIPDSLSESARIDGASYFRILVSIVLPLCGPTIAVMVLYYGVGHWNSWFNASIYLTDRFKYPLQLVMRNILDSAQTAAMLGDTSADDMARYVDLIKYALIVVTTAPILVLYPFLQRYFVKGVMIGAIKE